MKARFRSVAAIALLACAGAATADTITANYSAPFFNGPNVFGLIGGQTSVPATLINGTRTDTPGVGGANADIPVNFPAFCVEVNQDVVVNGGPDYTHNVVPLLGSSTIPISGTSVFFDAARTDRMERLWGTFYDNPTAQSVPDFSTAFQMAVWEIAFDNDMNLSTGNNVVTSAPGATLAVAQGWLDVIAGGGGTNMQLYLLQSDSAQDLITPGPAPAPGSAALLGLGGLISFRRRRH